MRQRSCWRPFDGAPDPTPEPLHARLREAARRHASAEGLEEELLSQAARELLLAQSGDWTTLIVTGAADEYARRRFDEHLARFGRLLQYIGRDEPTPDATMYLHEIAELDNAFPFAKYRLFVRG
jgi:1,4-alpha-glucan branching enzyme